MAVLCAFPYLGKHAPPFLGEKYFCESGNSGTAELQWYLTDPLWDSEGCASGSTCCDRGGPWFTTTLSGEVSNDIEERMCLYYPAIYKGIYGVEKLVIFFY